MIGLGWLEPKIQAIGEFIFFRSILSYLRHEIQEFGIELLGRVMSWVGMAAVTVLTLWILIQGFRIATGQSRDSLMALVMNSLKATLILSVATSMAMFGSDLHTMLVKDVKDEIHTVVTGSNGSPEEAIDRNFGWMQVAMSSIDVLDAGGDESLDNQKTRALFMVGFGTGGPAIVGGTMLLLNEVALALFIGLGPLFILCLLFDQTKALFGRWLYYGIGTMFSMAVLSAMVSIALEMVVRVASSFWGAALIGSLLNSNFTDGMTSQAMQQGGMGLILTTLIITAPPMAAAFFQGTLGHFSYASAFQNYGAGASANGRPPGTVGHVLGYPSAPAAPTTPDTSRPVPQRLGFPKGDSEVAAGAGRMGAAIR